MATRQDIINEWVWDSPEKQELVKTSPDFILRWTNQGELRFADKSEILRGIWTPTTASDGSVVLPSDFLREFPDRVKYLIDRAPLTKMNYEEAILTTFSTLVSYAIFNGTFYVFGPQAISLTIPYIKKPAVITSIGTTDNPFPTEYHKTMITFYDAMWLKEKGDMAGARVLLQEFDDEANANGMSFYLRNYPHPRMRSNWF